MSKKDNEMKSKADVKKEKQKDVKEQKEQKATKDTAAKNDVVEQARRELERLEAQAAAASSNARFPWGVFCGAVILTVAVILIGWKVTEMMAVNKLKAKLPEIIEPLGGGMEVEKIGDPVNQSGVYRFTIKFKDYDEEFTSYITRDAKTFFVDGYDVDELLGEAGDSAANSAEVAAAACEDLTKSDDPHLDAYVSSDCGYCKQAETHIAAAVAQVPELGDKITLHYAGTVDDNNNIIGFLGSADAGTENVRQVCIQSEQHDVFWPYIACMAAGGEAETCMSENGVNASEVEACMASEDRGLGIIKADIARANEHAVSGTPSFYLNDTDSVNDVSFGGGERKPDAYKQIICCASNTQGEYCAQTLE